MAQTPAGGRRDFAAYKRDVLHALGNPDEDDLDISAGEIVNDALLQLVSMHPWRWLQTGEETLSLTEDQNYIELPSDFGTLVSIEYDENWSTTMIETTWADLQRMRTGPIREWSRSYWFVIVTGIHADYDGEGEEGQAGLAVPRLEIYPTPAEDATDEIRIVYYRFLKRLEHDDEVPAWPDYMDRPLSLLARHMSVVDYDDAGNSPYGQHLQALMPDLMARDGMTASSFGVPRGGIWPRRQAISPFYPTNIPNPSFNGNQ